MTPRRGDYGFDSPYVPVGLAVAAVLASAVAAVSFAWSLHRLAWSGLAAAAVLALSAASFVWTTRRGKLMVWAELLDALALRGDERVLDVGCGRGAVLMLAAERLPLGRAVGLDLWSTTDQSGNSAGTTLRNAAAEGVRQRVAVLTGDMRQMPFPDRTFDIVTSSLAIHNIEDATGREQALAEIVRVLKDGGAALVADFRYTADYQRFLSVRTAAVVGRRRLGWRFWYGGPQAATTLLTARRPAGRLSPRA